MHMLMAFHLVPSVVPSVVLKGNDLLTKVPMDIDTQEKKHPDCLADSCKHSNVNRMASGPVMEFFFFHLLLKHTLCSKIKGFRPHSLLVYIYRLCLPPGYVYHISINIDLKVLPKDALPFQHMSS